MPLRLARLVIAAITIVAFLGAGLVQNMPSTQADTAGMAMMADHGDGGAAMPCHDTQTPPCQDKVPGCMTDLGCIFVVGIPVPPAPAVSGPAWFRVAYWQSVRLAEGLSPEPYLGPPIRLV
ncbi:hypothetical protein JYK14_08235 [Siccirubricoccus sp. KC 17139]|uniref:DUF2946 domain-containing protein n=1 Tax=Siccirubricoccus soli TaxID=2899147 RepID=A0ABT1D2J9_9PROT|nr:hypothetical protein [Siccirubricoccus soli]MCO6416154.1 hypothetical protein [Siccirubricoccus soli]MCP2682288.1 hypothetical protein [Siccirubricoccus soli]